VVLSQFLTTSTAFTQSALAVAVQVVHLQKQVAVAVQVVIQQVGLM
jgi:hypothetical protein